MTSMYKKTIIKLVVICTIVFGLLFESGWKVSSFINSSFYNSIEEHVSDFGEMKDDPSSLTNHCTKEIAVLDRIINSKQAVIMVEQLEEQWIVHQDELPKGSDVHMWFHIDHCLDTIEVIAIDFKKTKQERRKSNELMDQLRAKPRGSGGN